MAHKKDKRVCVLGSGNGGSVIAKIIATNCSRVQKMQEEVIMYVYEETIDGRKLADIINETHENVKYLPGRTLGNVVACGDLEEATREAEIIVFAIPHSSIKTVCASLLGKTKRCILGVVMVKGIDLTDNGTLEMASKSISNLLKIPTCVFTGFAFPGEVVGGKHCETSIAHKSKSMGTFLQALLQTETLRVMLLDDVDTVELFGSLKGLVGCAAGIADGLGNGYNCKAAIFRLGVIEIVKFLDLFYPHVKLATVFECCGLADLLIACFYGRDRRVAETMASTGLTLGDTEARLLDGRSLDSARAARDVYQFLRRRDKDELFPLFTAVHLFLSGELEAEYFLESIKSHPEHNLRLQKISW